MSTPNPFQKFTTKQFTPGGNPLARSVASLSHIFSPVAKAASAVGNRALDLVSSHTAYTAPTPDPRIAAILAGLAYAETRGVKGDRYKFSQPSGNKKLGNALGNYQITEGVLNELGPKYLGYQTTPQQYLNTPAIQDSFVSGRSKNLLEQGYTPQQIADIHRNGSTGAPGATRYLRPEYVQDFQRGYDEYTAQNRQK